jgi:transposase-like protein
MEESLRRVAGLLDGEAMTEVCRDFGVSRKTSYKIFDRHKEHGLEVLSDRSRRPVRYANQLPQQIESLIVRLKTEKPHWVRARSASSWSAALTAMSEFRPRAPSTRCSIARADESLRAPRTQRILAGRIHAPANPRLPSATPQSLSNFCTDRSVSCLCSFRELPANVTLAEEG